MENNKERANYMIGKGDLNNKLNIIRKGISEELVILTAKSEWIAKLGI